MTKIINSSMLTNIICNVLKIKNRSFKRIIITFDREKQVSDAGDQFILEEDALD